jgi:adenylate cyclase
MTHSYRIETEPLTGRVTANRNGVVLASSERAVVMYETRLPPAIYFPREDVVAPLSDVTGLQSFCPFKGTANYRNIELPDGALENAVWSYDSTLPESREIQGYCGFMPGVVTDMDLGGNILQRDVSGNISGPLIDWLLREAAFLKTPEAFTEALALKLRGHGIHLSRLSVMLWSLHPMIAGKNYIWELDATEVSVFAPSYEIHDHPAFVNSPLRHVSSGLGGIRQKLDAVCPETSFPIMQDLRAKGATDYVAMPMPFSDGRTNVLTLTSNHPDGFSTENLGLVFECAPVISRFYEVFMQKENAQSLLETYVGKRTGARVLGGKIRRGDGDEIDAAIMFCDLHESTRLAETLGRQEYLALLNAFFERTSTIVQEQGGEVLKFIGDAVLAIFPSGGDAESACAQAMQTARLIVAHPAEADAEAGVRYECSIGIAFGRVTYGNVGSRERLDFTVIGQAANLAARLSEYAKRTRHRIVLTGEVAGAQGDMEELGPLQLHNVSEPVIGFAMRTGTAA